MKTMNIKKASILALTIWLIRVSAFFGSYYFLLTDNADEQANWFLNIVLIPAIITGIYFYNFFP